MTATPDLDKIAADDPVNQAAPADPFDDVFGFYLHALEAFDNVARKAEAAGVLYGEPLYRELSVGLAAIREPLVTMRHAANHARHLRDTRIAELLAAVDEWAADYRKTTETLDRLTGRIAELETELDADAPLGEPSERAHGLIGILGTMNLDPDESAHIAAALRPASPPAQPADPSYAGDWMTTGDNLGHPITRTQADGIIAERSRRGLPLAGLSSTEARVWLDWARAGFPETPSPDTIANRPADPGPAAPEAGQ